MNLYKFNFDLAGSSNAVQTITIPTDSKYSMGLKFFKGSEELILGDDVKITIQDDKYIYTPTEIFNNYAVFAGATGSDDGETKTYQVNFHKDADEDLPEVNANFKGVNIKTNDSKISNWAITDSQMKIVYTDEWETMKDNADDRVIYFVVDKPTPPKPIPPKPTPGETRFGIRFSAPSESDEFDPNSVEDCLSKSSETSIKYTRDGVNYYMGLLVASSPSAEVQGDVVKVDQIYIPFEYSLEDDGKGYLECLSVSFENNKMYMRYFGKEVSSQEEAEELMAQYYFDRFGEEGTLPNTTNPIPSDIDDWKIVYEEEHEIQYTITDEYVYIPGLDPKKMLLNSETFPQWRFAGEPTGELR